MINFSHNKKGNKEEYEDVKEKLAELTDEELEQVTGGHNPRYEPKHSVPEYFAPEYALDSPGRTPETPSLR